MVLSRQHRAACSDADFIRLFEELGPTKTAQRLNVSLRAVHFRRKSMEALIRRQVVGPNDMLRTGVAHPHRLLINVQNGVVLIGSDAHLWPGPASTAWRALVKFASEMKPKALILNGDVMDFPQISRHPPIGWESRPTVQQEVENAQDRLHELEKATPRGCRLFWTCGNHDSRYETRIASVAPEFAKIHGVHLKDHFPLWEPCWSVFINDDVVVKHRWKGGTGATRANTLNSGKTMVTGHRHSLNVTRLTDYGGHRYGVDTGCLADTDHKAFVDYTEDAPLDWASGFCVLTFKDGVLLRPELVQVFDRDRVEWRGDLIKV